MVRKATVILLAPALASCMTSLSDIREKPAIETVRTTRAPSAVEECIILSQPGGRSPVVREVNGARELTITQESAGAVMHFTIRPVDGGSEVTFRRKGVLVNYDDDARRCYLDEPSE